MAMAFIIFYVTHPSEEEARRISDAIVSARLAACANIFPIQSAYWWDGQIETGQEWVSLLKTALHLQHLLQEMIERLHPYKTPCIMRWEVNANEAYENWILASVMSEEEAGRP
jgi:periplasmic divalent cation tolerance protein